MILKTETLYNDELAEKLDTDATLIWEEAVVDLRDVCMISPFMVDNDAVYEFTEILMKSGVGRVVKVPYHATAQIMEGIWGKAKEWEDILRK